MYVFNFFCVLFSSAFSCLNVDLSGLGAPPAAPVSGVTVGMCVWGAVFVSRPITHIPGSLTFPGLWALNASDCPFPPHCGNSLCPLWVKDREVCRTSWDFCPEIITWLYERPEMGTAVEAFSAANTLLWSFPSKLVQEPIRSISKLDSVRALKLSLFHWKSVTLTLIWWPPPYSPWRQEGEQCAGRCCAHPWSLLPDTTRPCLPSMVSVFLFFSSCFEFL